MVEISVSSIPSKENTSKNVDEGPTEEVGAIDDLSTVEVNSKSKNNTKAEEVYGSERSCSETSANKKSENGFINSAPEEGSNDGLDSEKVIHAETVSESAMATKQVSSEQDNIIVVENEEQIATLPFSKAKRTKLLDRIQDIEKDESGNLVTPLKIRRTRRKPDRL